MTGETDAFLLSGKDIMGVFDEVKERVTARAVMERAGIVFNRGNMCKCPFHQDKTASMKVKPMDKKYFCFGCGEKGDAIDFVASNPLMHSFNARRLLFISAPSANLLLLLLCVSVALSLPARSTKVNFAYSSSYPFCLIMN